MRQLIYNELSKRRFGVEIEVSNNVTKQQIGQAIQEYEITYKNPSHKRMRSVRVTTGLAGWAQTRKNSYWHVKYDSTCGPLGKNIDSGWEIASYIGSGIGDIDHISRLARFLNNFGLETNLNCGLHIHIEVKDFSSIEIGILLARWLKVEELLIKICHSSRKQNEYCKSLRSVLEQRKKTGSFMKLIDDSFNGTNYIGSPLDLWAILHPLDLGVHNNQEKKVTLNTVGFAISQFNPDYSRPTIELRLPESLLDEKHVKNWIRLILNFVETSKVSNKCPRCLTPSLNLSEILSYLGLSDDNGFMILEHELLSTKVWFLNKIIECSNDQNLIRQAKKHLNFTTLI
jgi:hypothetical protein